MIKVKHKGIGFFIQSFYGLAIVSLVLMGTLFHTKPIQALENTHNIEITVEQFLDAKNTNETIDKSIHYLLKSQNSQFPMPVGSENGQYSFAMRATQNKNISFSFNKAGIYEYELSPVEMSTSRGFAVDTQKYLITICVRNAQSGGFNTDVFIVREDGNKVSRITYNHAYSPLRTQRELMVDPPVKKRIRSIYDKPSMDAKFYFTLTAQNKNQPMPEGSKDGKKVMMILGEGEKDFGTWNYVSAGTYFYEISENKLGDRGYRYDTQVYTIRDVVEDIDGQLVLNRTVTNAANEEVVACDFVNTYDSNTVETGDRSNVSKWVLIALASSMMTLIIVYIKRKQGEEYEENR